MADFFLYWRPETVDDELYRDRPFDHGGSSQFYRATPGDTIWIVTVRSGSLRLVGKLGVGFIVDTAEARRRLGTDDLWDADYHAITPAGTEERLEELHLDHVVSLLRFDSPAGHDRLTLTDGLVSAQQLQTMRRLTQESAQLVRLIWQARDSVYVEELPLQEEIDESGNLYEGAVHKVTVNAFERNLEARRLCTAYYGARCSVCGFDFSQTYGDIGEGLIHVHHLRQLSEIGEEYQVDPIQDLRPVCPNCHAVIHRRHPAYSIEEMRKHLRTP